MLSAASCKLCASLLLLQPRLITGLIRLSMESRWQPFRTALCAPHRLAASRTSRHRACEEEWEDVLEYEEALERYTSWGVIGPDGRPSANDARLQQMMHDDHGDDDTTTEDMVVSS